MYSLRQISLVHLLLGAFGLPTPAIADQCGQHTIITDCIIFRSQHGCVWDVPSSTCMTDTPCEKRSQEQCQTELTSGVGAAWDSTSNKCVWDNAKRVCRWSDECFGLSTSDECVTARCEWKKLCTPMDMRSLPGPGQCSMTCVPPESNAAMPVTPQPLSAKRVPQQLSQEVLSDVVATEHGDIQGLKAGAVQEFLGIPFAAPPVGNLRWAPPQLLSTSKWNGTFLATQTGASCYTSREYYFTDSSACQGFTRGNCLGYSEDCLTLNTFTPATTGSRAVMMWIHGGCFVSGSASGYNGTELAGAKDVVVVVAQYRLAAFGFLGDELLRSRDPAGSTGNYGLMDNIAALKWIKANIASFGGDPNRVTIFGESSGAGSVSQLLGVEAAWPYFHRGIMESGTGSFWTYMDIGAAYTNFGKVTSTTGCSNSTDVVSCLVDAPADSISSAVSSVPCRDGCNWAPVIDGIFIKGQTVELARAGQLRPETQIISGFNLNDGAMFVPGFPGAMSSMTSDTLTSYYSDRFGSERVTTLGSTFPVQSTVVPDWLSRYYYSAQECETDFSYACTAQWVSTAATAQGSPSYVYQFSEPSTSFGLSLHGDEIKYVFGTLSSPTAGQSYVSGIMMDYWSNFAKTGNPNGGGAPDWPIWDATAPILNISSSVSVAYAPKDSFKGCDFFDSNWDYYGGCLPPVSSASGSHGGTFPFVI